MFLEISWCLKYVNNVFPNLKQAINIVIHYIKKCFYKSYFKKYSFDEFNNRFCRTLIFLKKQNFSVRLYENFDF